MSDTNLNGLDLEAAKEFILAFAVDIKRLDKAIAEAQGELERWTKRVALAEAKQAASLVQAARAKVEEEAEKIASLEAEREGLRSKVAGMRAQLPMIQARERSVDPDRLLAELQLMTGELLGDALSGTDAAFAELESEAKTASELEALKRRASDRTKP
jgi:capsule polysaccharide export protein KpsE/RkpR